MGAQNTDPIPPVPTAAPGQYLGFSLQASRMLDHLLRGTGGITVSLEVVGDTTIHAADSTLIEELKSRTSQHNPVSDRAIDFWKTLHNWIRAVESRTLDLTTTRFRLFVTRQFATNLVGQFSDTDDPGEIRVLLEQAQHELLQGDNAVAADSELGRHLFAVFSANRELVVAVLASFRLEFGTGRSWNELRVAMDSTIIPADSAEAVLHGLAGWLQQQINERLERGEPAAIAWNDFRNAAWAFLSRLDRRHMLSSFAAAPTDPEIQGELHLRTYVRQLELIEAEHDSKINAVTDYLKAAADRARWAQRGDVLPESFDDFERELQLTWQNRRTATDILHFSHSEIERGKLLYGDCCDHRAQLGTLDVPPHFCRGAFHKLADARSIGWHPRYDALIDTTGIDDGDGTR